MVYYVTWNHHTGWHMFHEGEISVSPLVFTSGASGPRHSLLLQAGNRLLVCINQHERHTDRSEEVR